VNEQRPDGFECFPRERLRVNLDRRQLLGFVWTELKVAAHRQQGGAAVKLPDLGSLSDELLELITPTISPHYRLGEHDDFLWAHPVRDGRPIKLFPASSPARRVLNHIDGAKMLGAVALRFSTDVGWEPELGFAYVRGVFLHLVTVGLCLPR